MPERKVSEKYLDRLWVRVIRLMYSRRCACCASNKVIILGHDAHHVIGRSDRRYRWHPLNGVFLCATHHRWAHEKPKEFAKWLKVTIPAVHSLKYEDGFDPKDRKEIRDYLLLQEKMLKDRLSGKPHQHKSGESNGTFLAVLHGVIGAIILFVYYLKFRR